MRVAVDSLLQPGPVQDCRDYTTLSVRTHCALPLVYFDWRSGRYSRLAASSYRIEAHGRAHTFTLRPDLRWSDGRPVTARCYRAGLERIAQSRTSSGRSALWAVRNFRTVSRGVASWATTEGVEADGLRLRVLLDVPDLDFARFLASPVFSPLRDDTPTLTAGAYIVSETDPQQAVLTRNPYYPDAGPTVETIAFTVYNSFETALDDLARGRLDVTADTQFPLQDLGRLRRTHDLAIWHNGVYASLTTPREATATPKRSSQRRRVLDAVDTEALGQRIRLPTAFRLGRAPAFGWNGPVPLDAASVPGQEPLTLTYADFPPNGEIAAYVAEAAAQAGVSIAVARTDYYDFRLNGDLAIELYHTASSCPIERLRTHLSRLALHTEASERKRILARYAALLATPGRPARHREAAALTAAVARHTGARDICQIPSISVLSPAGRHYRCLPGLLPA